MYIYKFRIILEEQEDFIRDIEIKSTQTFEDFHKAIIDSVGLDGSQLASFYICDQSWRKKKEITLIDMSEESESNEELLLMNKSKLKDFIEDPAQKILYVYDYLNMLTFFMELMKIYPAEQKVTYPRCIKSEGGLPRKYNPNAILIDPMAIDPEDEIPEYYVDEKNAEDTEDGFKLEYDDEEEGIEEESKEINDGFEEFKY